MNERWLFAPAVGSIPAAYRFPQNPAAMTHPGLQHRTTTSPAGIDGRQRALRAPDLPSTWSFTGKVRSKADYDALLAWSRVSGRIRVTDHLGRIHEVLPQAFEPVSVAKSGVPNPWLFTYTFKTLYLRRVA